MNHINQAATQCGMNAAPQNEIPSEMDNLQMAINALADYIGRLTCRIEPVLKDQPTSKGERPSMPPICSKVGGELRALTNNVNALIDNVDMLVNRVAL